MKKWKKLSTKQLLKHPRLNVFEDEVELPNGLQTKYIYFREATGAACVIGVNDDGKIFVQQEYSYPPNEWLFQFPGGRIEPGESTEQAAVREFAEEAQMSGKLTSVGWFYSYNRRHDLKFHVFVAHNLKQASAPKDAEEDFIDHWFTPEEIDTMIADGKITNASFLAAWVLYRAYLLRNS